MDPTSVKEPVVAAGASAGTSASAPSKMIAKERRFGAPGNLQIFTGVSMFQVIGGHGFLHCWIE